MDIEKLIEQLNEYSARHQQHGGITAQAADALTALQTENEKLRDELKRKVNLVFQQAKELDRRNLFLQEQEAELDDLRTQWDMYGGDVGITAVYKELERVKRALAMMWFAYVNSDKEDPHNYETEALEEAERLLGPWKECMPKYLRRGQKED